MDLITIAKALALGLVEGATEFIPVSSTGHLIIVSHLLQFTGDRAKTFGIFIQLGAILAIVWIYREAIAHALAPKAGDPWSHRLLAKTAVAFLPAAIIGFLAHSWIKAHLFTTEAVGMATLVGGILILVIERWHVPTRFEKVSDVPMRTALGVGIAQVLALVPGTSRSGATIMGAYLLGLSRKAATEFSFFLAIPVIAAAACFELASSWSSLAAADLPIFATGFVAAFLSALVVVRAFVTFISNHSFTVFAWYRIVLGIVLLGFSWRLPQ